MNIEELISLYLDGELSSEAEGELHYRLAVSPDDRKVFRELIALRNIARDQRVQHIPDAGMRSALFDRLQREEGMTEVAPALPPIASIADRNEPAVATPYGGDRPPVGANRGAERTERRRRRLIPILLTLLLLTVASGVTWQLWDNGSRDSDGTIASMHEIASPPPATPPTATTPSPGTERSDAKPGNGESAILAEMASSEPTERTEASAAARNAAPQRVMAASGRLDRALGTTHDFEPSLAMAESAAPPVPPSESVPATSEQGGELTAAYGEVQPSATVDSVSTTRLGQAALMAYDEGESMPANDLAVTSYGSVLSNTIQSGLLGGEVRGRSRHPQLLGTVPTEPSRSGGLRDTAPHILINPSLIAGNGAMAIGGDDASSPISSDSWNANAPQSLSPYQSLTVDRDKVTLTNIEGKTSTVSSQTIGRKQNEPTTSLGEKTIASAKVADDAGPIGRSDSVGSSPRQSEEMDSPLIPEASPASRRYFTSIGGGMMKNTGNGTFAPDLQVRLGVEFDDGRQRAYLAAGYSGYREESNTVATSIRRVGTVIESSTMSSRSADIAYEVWWGGGYGYTTWFDNLGVGAEVSISLGSQYVRAGAELPISLRIGDQIRFDAGPTLQYARAIDHSPRVSTSGKLDPALPFSKQTTQTTTKDQEEVRAGVGIGAGMTVILR